MTDARLIAIIQTPTQQNGHEPTSSEDTIELSGVKRCGSHGSNHSLSSENGTGIQVEVVITQFGPELASINCKELRKFCKALEQRVEEYVGFSLYLSLSLSLSLTLSNL